MNNKVIKLGLLLVLSCVIIVSSVACRSVATENQTETVNVTLAETANEKRIGTPDVKQGDMVPRVTADGRLSFVEDRRLTFGTGGKIGQVNVSELDRVTKGQVLAKLDTTPLEQAVKAAEFGVKAAEFDRDQAENGIKFAEADLKTAQGNLEAIKIDLKQATDNFRKIAYPYNYHTVYLDVPEALGFVHDGELEIMKAVEELQVGPSAVNYGEVSHHLRLALDSLTKSQDLLRRRGYGDDVFASEFLPMQQFWTLRAAQLQNDKVQVAMENAENVVNKTALAIDNARTVLNKAQVAVDKAKNDLDRARDELEKAVITAPFDGVIAKVNVEEGDFLSANYAATIAIEIIDPSRMELDVKVNELDIPNVKLGQKAAISVDALPDEWFEGVVTSIGSLPDVQAGVVSYEVIISFDVPQNLALKAGMGATADIIIEKRS